MKNRDTNNSTSMPTYTCCFCRKSFVGFGNDAYPMARTGVCCDECNSNIVVPVRIMGMHAARSKKTK